MHLSLGEKIDGVVIIHVDSELLEKALACMLSGPFSRVTFLKVLFMFLTSLIIFLLGFAGLSSSPM